MPNLPTQSEQSTDAEQRRICDFCGETTAVLFCRADAAKLCLGCDREVHSTNQLFTNHTRWLLCDACDSSPALILCSTHGSVFCHNCDFELHTGSCTSLPSDGSASITTCPSLHDRRPLEGFSGRPSVSEIASFVGLDGLDFKSLDVDSDFGLGILEGENEVLAGGFWGIEETRETNVDGGGDGVSDFWAWEAIASQGVVSINDLIVSSDENHGFQAMVDLDSLPKDRNSACGQHKQEIIRQLCKLEKSETGLNKEFGSRIGHQTTGHEHAVADPDIRGDQLLDLQLIGVPGNEASWYLPGSEDDEALKEAFLCDTLLGSYMENVPLGSNVDSDLGSNASLAVNGRQEQALNVTESVAPPSKIPTREFNSAERDSALSRYKEKKRNRRYDKHIRYESRKVLAESRTRVRGRFTKVDKSTTRADS